MVTDCAASSRQYCRCAALYFHRSQYPSIITAFQDRRCNMDIQYFTIPELGPDRPMFRCERRSATIQASACATMWRGANDQREPEERFLSCRNCQIGARHAGINQASLSPLRGMSICARCHTGTTRLIRGHLCVSCMNRQYEYLKGRNAKGKTPVRHPTLYQIPLRYSAGGVVKRISMQAADSEELVVATLRDERKQVTFSFVAIGPALPQGDLFR